MIRGLINWLQTTSLNNIMITLGFGSFGLCLLITILKDIKQQLLNKYHKINQRIYTFDFIKYLIKYEYRENVYKFIISFAGLELLNYAFKNGFKWYFYGLLLTIPLVMFLNYSVYDNNIKRLENKLESFNYIIKILAMNESEIRVASAKPLDDKDKVQLGLIFKTNVKMIQRENNIYIIKHSSESIKYLDFKANTLPRLEQILIDLKAKPEMIGVGEQNENETIYTAITQINPKRFNNRLVEIEHKLGAKKGTLTIDHDKGYTKFIINNELNKKYYLDDILGSVKTNNMELPFVAGVDSTGKVIVKDLMKLPHLGIFGKTGSGKSTTFLEILISMMWLTKGKQLFYMIDFARVELNRFKGFSNVKVINSEKAGLETKKAEIEKFIAEIHKIMDDRQDLFANANVVKIAQYNKIYENIPYITIVIDEANRFREWWKNEKDPIYNDMYRILSEGRKYGLNVIMTGQRWGISNSFMRGNLKWR